MSTGLIYKTVSNNVFRYLLLFLVFTSACSNPDKGEVSKQLGATKVKSAAVSWYHLTLSPDVVDAEPCS